MNCEKEQDTSSKETSNFSRTVHNVIKRCITSNGEPIKINIISELENCEKRRLYDLFNVLCALGLCTKSADKTYIWRGKENMIATITKEYENFEVLSLSMDVWSILQMSESPPIGKLAITMILIYLVFNESEMSLKQLCMIMAQKRSKMSKLLRRLYLAAFFLEQLEVISHSFQIGSYEIIINANEIIKNAFNSNKVKMAFPIGSITSNLSYINTKHIMEIKAPRKIALYNRMKQFHIPLTQQNSQTKKHEINLQVEPVVIVSAYRDENRCNIPLLNMGQRILLESF